MSIFFIGIYCMLIFEILFPSLKKSSQDVVHWIRETSIYFHYNIHGCLNKSAFRSPGEDYLNPTDASEYITVQVWVYCFGLGEGDILFFFFRFFFAPIRKWQLRSLPQWPHSGQSLTLLHTTAPWWISAWMWDVSVCLCFLFIVCIFGKAPTPHTHQSTSP